MKYPKLNLGKIEAAINKLGGMEGLDDFLSGKTEVVQRLKLVDGFTSSIALGKGSNLQIIKSGIHCPCSDGSMIFSELDDSFKKTTYDGKGGSPDIKYLSDLNKMSYPKDKGKVTLYEFKKLSNHKAVPLCMVFHKIFSLVDGDLKKISLNVDQIEYIVLKNKELVCENGQWPNFFFLESDNTVLPVSIKGAAGGMGKIFETKVYPFSDISFYPIARFFVRQ